MSRFVRYASLTGYAELARSLGLEPARLLADEGLDIADLAEQDKWIPAVPVARLLERSAAESGVEDFGVRLSARRRLSALGPLSVVLREEPDLRSALDLLVRYEQAYSGVVDLRPIEADGLATVQVWLDFEAPVPTRQSVDLTAANLVGVLRALVRADWQPLSVVFAHGAPADLGFFRQTFGPGLRFDQPFTGLVMPAGDLDLPTVTADPALRSYARRLLPTPRPATTTAQVRSMVEVLLPAGRCSLGHVSRALHLPPRSLHRHLAEEGGELLRDRAGGARPVGGALPGHRRILADPDRVSPRIRRAQRILRLVPRLLRHDRDGVAPERPVRPGVELAAGGQVRRPWLTRWPARFPDRPAHASPRWSSRWRSRCCCRTSCAGRCWPRSSRS